MNVTIILAAGSGSRFGGDEPKQFAKIGDRTVLEHSVAAFAAVDGIDEICVVTQPEWIDRVSKFKVQGSRFKVIAGGSERYMSSLNAIMAYIDYPDDTNLLFHDAARPNVSKEVIESVLHSLGQYEAVGVGVPATDTLWEVALLRPGGRTRGPDDTLALHRPCPSTRPEGLWRPDPPSPHHGVGRDRPPRPLPPPPPPLTFPPVAAAARH